MADPLSTSKALWPNPIPSVQSDTLPKAKVTGEEPWGARVRNVDSSDFSGSTAYRAKINQWIANEDAKVAAAGLRRRPGTESFVKYQEGVPKGLAVLWHGLSVSPDQMKYLVDDLFAKGYDVFIPALPGHGLVTADGKEDTSLVPTANTWKDWGAFAESVYQAASGSGAITLVGLSCGGMLSLKMAEDHAKDKNEQGEPVIKQIIAISPFLGFSGTSAQLQGAVAGALTSVFPDTMTSLLSTQKVFVEGKNPGKVADGFTYVNKAQALGMNLAAQEVLKGAEALRGIPMLFIISEADDQADPNVSKQLAKQLGADTLIFTAEERVQHALNNPDENPNAASVELTRQRMNARF